MFCFKGRVTWYFFHELSSPKPLKIMLESFKNCKKIRRDIRKSRYTTGIDNTCGKFCHWCQLHQWKICYCYQRQLCRASMHSFFIDCQSLRELRITSVLIIAAIQKEMALGLRQGCSLQRRVTHQITQGWHIRWIKAVGEFGRSTGDRRWPTAATPPPPHPGSLDVPGQGLETNRGYGGGGGNKAWVCTWSTYAQLVPERRL